jgi:hypothetical protein
MTGLPLIAFSPGDRLEASTALSRLEMPGAKVEPKLAATSSEFKRQSQKHRSVEMIEGTCVIKS